MRVERFALSHLRGEESNTNNTKRKAIIIIIYTPSCHYHCKTTQHKNHWITFTASFFQEHGHWQASSFLQHNGHGKCCMLSEEVKIASSIASRPTDYCLNLRFHRFHNFQLQPLEEIRMPYKRYQSELPFLQQHPKQVRILAPCRERLQPSCGTCAAQALLASGCSPWEWRVRHKLTLDNFRLDHRIMKTSLR